MKIPLAATVTILALCAPPAVQAERRAPRPATATPQESDSAGVVRVIRGPRGKKTYELKPRRIVGDVPLPKAVYVLRKGTLQYTAPFPKKRLTTRILQAVTRAPF